MIVLTMTNCPPKLRGDLSKWLLEINTGVYVGHLNARVREALWERVCENIGSGQATMVFSADNEQHMDFYVVNNVLKPVDYDGLKLMKHLDTPAQTEEKTLKQGFSIAAKRRMGARKRRQVATITSYCILDLETTGLSPEKDEITEIGVLTVENGIIVDEYEQLIRINGDIPREVEELTGINSVLLNESGVPICDALTRLFEIIDEKTVLMYNADFDCRFLECWSEKCGLEFPEIEVKDVLPMARNCLEGLGNYKLETVAHALDINIEQTHRAVEDSKMLFSIYNKLNENS